MRLPILKALTLSQILLCSRIVVMPAEHQPPNTLSAAEQRDGWTLLFDGKTLSGWRSYNPGPASANGWTISQECIARARSNGRPGNDLLTVTQFTDFDFTFEWRISSAGNSGVKYSVIERQSTPGAPMWVGDDGRSAVGLEYQLLDDQKHPDATNGPIRQTGALYSLIPPNGNKHLRPVGEFNQSRILVRGNHVEHWLNGAKILEYELGSEHLAQAIAGSKYKAVPRFGTKFKTALLLQDHGDEVWFRNLKIRVLAN